MNADGLGDRGRRILVVSALGVVTASGLAAPPVASPVFGQGPSCRADIDESGTADFQDLVLLLAAWGPYGDCPPPRPEDLNEDCEVGFDDLVLLLDGWGPCPVELELTWPMPGKDAKDWVINNYVDLDPGSGVRDYMDGEKTYDGHRGVDIDVPNFRYMDADWPILAAAAGTVVGADDTHPDRNTSCSGQWNFVTIEHANGWRTIYGHLKRDSIVVSIGDEVAAGQTIAVVGSSGCSTAPHLHIEVRDEGNAVMDPFLEGMWIDPPVYDTPLGFMDAVLIDGPIAGDIDLIKDPPPNIDQINGGSVLGTGLSMAGGGPGDEVQIRMLRPGGEQHAQATVTFGQTYRHTYWYWDRAIGTDLGEWTIQVRLNGDTAASYAVLVTPTLQSVHFAIPRADYQAVFDQAVAGGYRLVWIDGYNIGSAVYFNAIFDQTSGGPWVAAHDLDGATYQDLFDTLTGDGYRLVHIDAYLSGDTIRYAPIFVQRAGSGWATYHGVPVPEHQQRFDEFVAQGYRPVLICPVAIDGQVRVTALYDRDDVGGFVALFGLTENAYQEEFERQADAGRALAYINGYADDGARLSAIWNSIVPDAWVARHAMSLAQLQAQHEKWTGQGLRLRQVTGYSAGRQLSFAALWTD